MRTLFVSIVLAAIFATQALSVHAQAPTPTPEPPIWAIVTQYPTACLRPAPNLSETCFYNIPFQGMSILMPGNSLHFYKVNYADDDGIHHIGWVWRNRVSLIYP